MRQLPPKLKKALKSQDWECTFWPDINYSKCCIAHDYRCADARFHKSKDLRKRADRKLRNCVNKLFPLMGGVMYIGVRSFNLYKKVFGRPEY